MLESALERVHELGWEYWGALECGGELVIADPGYIGAAYAPVGDDEAQANFTCSAKTGSWHVFVRRAPPDRAQHADVEVWELCGCHESALLEDFEEAYDEADERAAVVVDSGKACIIDAARRDDAEFRENVFWAHEGECVDNAGFTTLGGSEGGAYPVFVRGAELADLVVLVFDWLDDDGDDEESSDGGD